MVIRNFGSILSVSEGICCTSDDRKGPKAFAAFITKVLERKYGKMKEMCKNESE